MFVFLEPLGTDFSDYGMLNLFLNMMLKFLLKTLTILRFLCAYWYYNI